MHVKAHSSYNFFPRTKGDQSRLRFISTNFSFFFPSCVLARFNYLFFFLPPQQCTVMHIHIVPTPLLLGYCLQCVFRFYVTVLFLSSFFFLSGILPLYVTVPPSFVRLTQYSRAKVHLLVILFFFLLFSQLYYDCTCICPRGVCTVNVTLFLACWRGGRMYCAHPRFFLPSTQRTATHLNPSEKKKKTAEVRNKTFLNWFPLYIYSCRLQGTLCAFVRMAGIVCRSVGGACMTTVLN